MADEFWRVVASYWIRDVDLGARRKREARDMKIKDLISLDISSTLLDDDYEEIDDW